MAFMRKPAPAAEQPAAPPRDERRPTLDVRAETRHRRAAPRIGVLRPAHIERAFVAMLYLTMLALIVLSVLGTFFGLLAQPAPILHPLMMIGAARAHPNVLALAVVVQIVLSLTQYGARQMAQHDRRWWLLYLVALAVSVYYNVQAYWVPLTALTVPPVAGLLIVAGDVFPEFLAVRHE